MPFDEASLTTISYVCFLAAMFAYIGHLVALTGRLSRMRVERRERAEFGGVQPAFTGAGLVASSSMGEATLTLSGRPMEAVSASQGATSDWDGDPARDAGSTGWPWFGRAGLALTAAGSAALTLAMAIRWQTSGHAPWVSLYEVTMMLSWGTAILYLLLMEGWMRVRSVGAFALLIVFMLQSYALYVLPAELHDPYPLVPALRSGWFYIHVPMAIIAYSCFAVAAAAAMLYLVKYHELGSWTRALPSLAAIDEFIFRAVAVGFPFQTLLLITGAYWAQVAWSKAWSWDPKEVWALITWLAYAAFLHIRVQRGWRGTTVAWMALAGFVTVMITFVGVNYLVSWFGLQSMHTYSGDTPGLLAFALFGGITALLLGSLVARDVLRRRRRARP